MVANQGKITTMGGTTGLVDQTDKMHTGILKALEAYSKEDICIGHAGFTITGTGTYTQYNLAQPIHFTTKGQYKKHTSDISITYDTTVTDAKPTAGQTQHPNYTRYDLISITNADTPTLVITLGTLSGANGLVPDLPTGNIPIALIEVTAGTDPNKINYNFQLYTLDKQTNSLSIGYSSGGFYTEVSSITGTSDGLFISGIADHTSSLAGADKVLIQDADASNVMKTVTAQSIANLSTGDITSVVAGSALTGGGTTGDVTLNVGVDDSTIEINSDALRLKDSGITVGKMAANSVDSDQYVDGSVDNIHLATGIDAVKIADGTVTNEEFQRLNTLTSNAQTQLNTKLQVGQFSMWIPAEAISPQSVNPCGSLTTTANANATQPDFRTLAFDAGTDEFAQFSIAMPKMWNEGAVLFTFYWTHVGSAGNDVIWTIAGTSVSNDEAIGGVIFGTAVNYQDTALDAKDLHIVSSDTTLTIAGSPAVGDVCFFQISRDANNGNDDFASDALLIGVKMKYTVDGLNDE